MANAGIVYIWMMPEVSVIRPLINHSALRFISEPTTAHAGLVMLESVVIYQLINAVVISAPRKRLFIVYHE
ncbi:unnamed protein product, partial [Onchocerca flexuosa]|uniref:7TM_GPCR_Srx domain-containing protein n=1 Tax=Onchocerca flexuosa TaxID=387005 RepID=A0A183HUC2_9BILA